MWCSSLTSYKLVRYGGRPVLELNAGKVSLPDTKQVYRFAETGRFDHDLVALRDEPKVEGEPLLQQVMAGGRIREPLPGATEIRERFLEEFSRLHDRYKALREPERHPVKIKKGSNLLLTNCKR